MSLYNNAPVVCGNCGHENELSWAASVNADRRPDLRAAIVDESFQAETCANCESLIRLPPHLTYIDIARKDWILVEDPAELGEWEKHEAEAEALFDQAFGPTAPKVAQSLAEGVQPRLVFGWPALREKLLLTELGIDDTTLELAKMALLASAQNIPIGEGTSLRLIAATDDTLTLRVVEDATEHPLSTADVPRALLDAIAGDQGSWTDQLQAFAGHAFVDISRFSAGA